jgi:hypothetical protein
MLTANTPSCNPRCCLTTPPCTSWQALEAELLPALAGICYSAANPATAAAALQTVRALLAPLNCSGEGAGGNNPRGSVDEWVASQQQNQQRGGSFGNIQQQQKSPGRQRQWQEEEGEEEEEQERYMQQQQRQQGKRAPGGASWQQEQEQGPGLALGRGSPTKAAQQSSGRVGGGGGGAGGGAASGVEPGGPGEVAALGRSCSAGSVAAGMELLALAGEGERYKVY